MAFPTETVYGLGGNAYDAGAASKIYGAKGRPSDNPLIVHVSSVAQAEALVTSFPECAKKLAERLWPGPLTMVLPKKPEIPDTVTGGLSTVAIRFPAEDSAAKLIEYAGLPIAAPSANLSGKPSPTLWQHCYADLSGKVDAIIQGPACIGGIESTIVDLTGALPQILRPGLITPEVIEQSCGMPCSYDPAILTKPGADFRPKAPGMKYKHYAPSAKMVLFKGEAGAAEAAMQKKAAELSAQGEKIVCLSYPNGRTAAAKLFADLRKADAEGCSYILACALADGDSINYSVMNRMLKAAGYNIIEIC